MTSHPLSSAVGLGVNRRRHDRQAVVQKATIRIASGASIPCEIRDFCQGGVFLKVPVGESSTGSLQAHAGEPIEIHFAALGGDASLQMCGRIAHLSTNGVGVAFTGLPPAAALVALQEIARPAASTPSASVSPSGTMAGVTFIQENCRQALSEILSEVLADFFAHIVQALLESSEKAGTNAEQASYFEAMTQFQAQRSQIENLFRERVHEQVESLSAQSGGSPSDTQGSSGLSLVENSEFEDWLNLNEQIAKVENLHDVELQRIEQRVSSFTRRKINHNNNPYGPGMLSRAFRSALSGLQLDNRTRRVVYGIFSQALHPRLGPLYEKLDEITRPLEESRSASSLVPGIPEADRPAEAAATPSLPSSQTPDPPGLHQESPPTPMGVIHAASVLWELCGQPQPVTEQVPAGKNVATPASLMRALCDLQAEKTAQSLDYIPSEALTSRLAHALSSQGVSSTLSREHKQTVDMLGEMLDDVIADDAVASAVKPYLQKLQIPLLESAVADPAFLGADNHPARDVLNLIDQFSIAINDKGCIENKLLRQSLGDITDRIVSEAAEKPAVFVEARQMLEKLAAPLLKARSIRIERVREACEGGQRIAQARRLVAREIGARIEGKTVPAVVPALLDAGWRELLVLTALRHGDHSEAWSHQLGVVDKLLAWLAPEATEGFAPALEVHALIDFVEEHLLTMCPDQALFKQTVDDLTAYLLGVGSPKEKRSPERVFVPIGAKALESGHRLDDRLSRQLKQVRLGDWLKFFLTPDEATPMRLAWVGHDPARYVFVNQRGGKGIELGAEEFARYLHDRRAVKTESLDLPLVERTANTFLQRVEDRLRHEAAHDPVTGLINRREFVRQLERHLNSDEQQDVRHMLCLMEIDQLRIINNLCGEEAVENLLKEVSGIMGERMQEGDLLARIGDNNFGVLFRHCSSDEGQGRAKNLLDALRDYHFSWQQRSFFPGISMGLASFPFGLHDVNALIRNADAACQAAKQKGRGLMHLYAEEDRSLAVHNHVVSWAGRLDTLLSENRLFVRCQLIEPIFPERGLAPHHEILLGVRDEQGGIVAPGDFVTAVERLKRMSEIDRWQVLAVFHWVRRNSERFQQIGGFSINLSGQSLNSDEFLVFLREVLAAGDFPTEKITFEITETAAVTEFAQAEKFIRQIKRYGCKFSLDDFGSGFSSYAYLKHLQVDYLKIDGAFVKDLASSPTDYALVKSMNEIGHSLGMKTIAEYVENDAILNQLRAIGVDYAQGYGIRKPMLLEELV